MPTSLRVGTFGNAGKRLFPVIPSALSLPDAMLGIMTDGPVNMPSVMPLIRSVRTSAR